MTTTSAPAWGQASYRLAPVGGRTTLVGGTGVAFGRDGASTFLNPATAVRVDESRLSFSVNFYTMTFVHAPRWYRPGEVNRAQFGGLVVDGASTTDFEFNALPSSLCFFFKVPEIGFLAHGSEDTRARGGRLGLCFATVQGHAFNFAADQYDSTAGGVTRQVQTVSQTFTRFALGPTYAMNITDHFAIGASLHGSIASHRSLFAATANSYGTTPSAITSMFYNGARGDSLQFTATAGATLKLGPATIGAAVESPSLHFFGVGAANLATHFEGAGAGTSTTGVRGSFKSQTPLRLSLGAGVEDRWGSLEVNASYWLPQQNAYRAQLEGRVLTRNGATLDDQPTEVTLSGRTRGVVNVGIGAQVFVLPRVSLLGGASTDFTAVPDGALTGNYLNYFPSQAHRITGSFGIGSHGDGGDLLFGTEASFGFGDRLAVNSYQLPPTLGTTSFGSFQLLFVIAGSTSLKAITRAVRDVRELTTDEKK